MFKSFKFFLIFIAIWTPQKAYSAIVDYSFTGDITEVDASIDSAFSVGEQLLGTFSVESDNPTIQPIRTIYDASNLSLTIGENYSIFGTEGSLIISTGNSFVQSFIVTFSGSSVVAGDPINGQSPEYFDIQLDWFSGAPFSSESLPLFVALNTGETDRSNINFPSDSERLSFETTSIQVIPIPAAVFLFGSAIFVLFGIRGGNERVNTKYQTRAFKY